MSIWTAVENPGTRPPRSWAFDVGCALLAALASFGVFSFAQAAPPAHPPLAVSLAVAGATVLVLSLRRVWPGPVFGVTVVMAAVLAQWPVRGALYPVALAISLYTVAAMMSRAAALTAAVLAVAAEAPAAGQGGWHDGWLALIYEVIAVAAVLVAGLYASTRRAYLAELRDRAQRLEREHDQTSALAAAVERARIAREMHDSVAHHLTVIVALSDGALAAVTRSPAQASEAIRGVSTTARRGSRRDPPAARHFAGGGRAGTPAAAPRPVRPRGPVDPGPGGRAARSVRAQRAARGHAARRSAGRLPARPGSPDEHDEARRPGRERGRPAADRTRRDTSRSRGRRSRQLRRSPRARRRPHRDG